MNKFFLVVRIILLLALVFLLAAVFWGLANRESTQASNMDEVYERYQRSKPAAYTAYLLVALVILGIFITLASILFEYHQYRKGSTGQQASASEEDPDRPRWS
jgi:TRAP-type C4-dicarboxylate transport system permease small subunit